MKKEKYYFIAIILLISLNIAFLVTGFTFYRKVIILNSETNKITNNPPTLSEIIVPKNGLTFKTSEGERIAKLYVEENEYGYTGDRNFEIYNSKGEVINQLYTYCGGIGGGLKIFYPDIPNAAPGSYGGVDLHTYKGGGILNLRSEAGNVGLSAGKDAGILEITNNVGDVIAIIRPSKNPNEIYLMHSPSL